VTKNHKTPVLTFTTVNTCWHIRVHRNRGKWWYSGCRLEAVPRYVEKTKFDNRR